MTVLEIRDLHVSVDVPATGGGEAEGPKEILRGVDLTVRSGETHAIMGPNGSGKSTLAYSIAGHPKYHVTSGTVTLDGEDVLAMSVDERARAGLFLAMQYPGRLPGEDPLDALRAPVQRQVPRHAVDRRQSAMWTMASTSTDASSGRATTPTADRACTPRLPKAAANSSLAPLTTPGCPVNEGSEATNPTTALKVTPDAPPARALDRAHRSPRRILLGRFEQVRRAAVVGAEQGRGQAHVLDLGVIPLKAGARASRLYPARQELQRGPLGLDVREEVGLPHQLLMGFAGDEPRPTGTTRRLSDPIHTLRRPK